MSLASLLLLLLIAFGGCFIISADGQELDLSCSPLPVTVSESQISFLFYKSGDLNNPNAVFTADNYASFQGNSAFEPSCINVILVHGWNGTVKGPVNVNISQALFNSPTVGCINLFLVDWTKYSSNILYGPAAASVQGVGNVVGKFIEKIMLGYALSSSQFYLIGFSLGAHVCGFSGKYVLSKQASLLGKIVGLDAALPCFLTENSRLNSGDAAYVQGIHCNAGELGQIEPVGIADYYPNGGSLQPGCLPADLMCSHTRCPYLYAASITYDKKFVATCDTCTPTSSWAGSYDLDTSAKGKYNLTTTGTYPYYQ